jgi:hypothetical protein
MNNVSMTVAQYTKVWVIIFHTYGLSANWSNLGTIVLYFDRKATLNTDLGLHPKRIGVPDSIV